MLDERILTTFRDLSERIGVANVTISAVAAESGVSRNAIYRRWPSRAALMFEAQTSRSVEGGFPDHGSLRADLVDAVIRLVDSMVEGDRVLTAAQLGQMIQDRSFADEVWENRWGPDRDAMYGMWGRAIERGEVDPAIDGRAVMEDLVATTIFQVMLSHRTFEGDVLEAFVDRVLDGVTRR